MGPAPDNVRPAGGKAKWKERGIEAIGYQSGTIIAHKLRGGEISYRARDEEKLHDGESPKTVIPAKAGIHAEHPFARYAESANEV